MKKFLSQEQWNGIDKDTRLKILNSIEEKQQWMKDFDYDNPTKTPEATAIFHSRFISIGDLMEVLGKEEIIDQLWEEVLTKIK